MLTGSYRKRLDADLVRWVGEGLLPPDSAAAIRRSLGKDAGFRLPALLGLFGGLLIASSVAAFVAANWEGMPRLLKLCMILAAIAAALGLAARLQSRGSLLGADAASTCGALIFGAGIALVGQMYHLPADWPSGALLVALGAFAVALLQRSNGALVVAFVALVLWSGGRWQQSQGALHWPFLLLYLPLFWLALGRSNRFVHHMAVLAMAQWFVLLPGDWLDGRFDYGLLAYALGIACAFAALGALALDKGGPALATCFLPWGLMVLMVVLGTELVRILDASLSRAGSAGLLNYLSYGLALASIGAFALLARERRFAFPLAGALVLSLLVPVTFWSGGVVGLPGKAAVAGLVLTIAIALVIAGVSGGVRRIMLAGSGLFGLAVLILLWQTIGTLLDQSLFFLVAGALLLALASGARKLFARFSPQAEASP